MSVCDVLTRCCCCFCLSEQIAANEVSRMGWLLEERQFVRVRISNVLCAVHAKKRRKMSERVANWVYWFCTVACSLFARNLCSLSLAALILTYANNAQKCLDGVRTHTQLWLQFTNWNRMNLNFSRSFFQCSVCLFVWLLLHTLFLVRPFLSHSDCPCQLRHSCLNTHTKTRPLPISIIIFAIRETESEKKMCRLKSYTNKLNWIYFSSGNESE